MSDTIDRSDAVHDELAAMRAELAELRARLDAKESAAPAPAPVAAERAELVDLDHVTDRRSLLRRGGAAAAAAAAGGAALVMGQASPAAALDGGNMIIGQTNLSTNSTLLRGAGAVPAGVLHVQDGGSAPVISLFPSVINGWADGTNANILHGVYGWSTKAGGYGVVGIGQEAGVFASGSAADIAFGGLGLIPNGTANARGNLVFTALPGGINGADSSLWFCHGSAGTDWRKLSGPGTAGALHLLPAPVRIYDSRSGAPFNNETRTIDAKAKLGGGSSGVPSGAQAVVVNFAVTSTSSGGFGTLFAADVADPGTASVNWGGMSGFTLNNTVLTAVDGTSLFKCKVASFAHVILDVVGYYQ